jgi:hypothetical protein
MYRWERREKKLQSQKKRMPKHGKKLGEYYKQAVEKENQKS